MSKQFSIPVDRVQTLKERALHPVRSRQRNEFSALKDVSLSIERGEFFGLVGRNGSGKSTLLKCIAGIYQCDSGRINHSGTIASFIELGVGFNPELAALDNVVLNATLMGRSREQARAGYEQVMEFAELWEFENLKLKNYSSGMYVRLAFSVMMQVDADILLIDEILAVGDAAFQKKCFDEFDRLKAAGKTIIFVTHGMDAIKRFCDRAALLERGNLVAVGPAEDISNQYLTLNFDSDGSDPAAAAPCEEATLLDVWVEDAQGERRELIERSDAVTFGAIVRFDHDVNQPRIIFSVLNEHRQVLLRLDTDESEALASEIAAGNTLRLRFEVDCQLAPGHYLISVKGEGGGSAEVLFDHELVKDFDVAGQQRGSAVLAPTYRALASVTSSSKVAK